MKAALCLLGTLLLAVNVVSTAKRMEETNDVDSSFIRSVYKRSVVGALKPMDGSESQLVKELGDYALTTLDDVDEDNVKRTVIDVIDAKKQLVNGIMYHLELKVQDTACLETQDITDDDSCLSKTTGRPKICKIRMHSSFADKSPHSARVVSSECNDVYVGDIQDVKPDSEQIWRLANFTIDHLNALSNSIYWYKIASVVDAKTQVKNGVDTFLTLELRPTTCLKSGQLRPEEGCSDDTSDADATEKMICHVVVWEQLWTGKRHVKKSSCSTKDNIKKRPKRSNIGTQSSLDAQKIEELKLFLSAQLTSRANSDFTKTVVEVLNSSTQLVSGRLTTAVVRVADTICLKSENRAPTECTKSSQGHQICTVTIMEQPWLNKKELTQSDCHAVPSMDVGPANLSSSVDCLYNCDTKLA